MRKLIFLSFIFAPAFSFAGDKNSLSGNWKEVSRKKVNNDEIPFTDSIRFEFLTGNEYIWQKAGGFIYKGTYKIEGNALDIGMRAFTIVERKPNKLVLKDEAGIYEFVSYKPAPNTPAAKRQEVYAPVNNIQQMVGHWSVYKRTSDHKTEQIDYTRQLKMVDVFDKQQDGKWGTFHAQRDADGAPSWYIENYANQTIYCDGKDKRQFKVIKCENNELILSEGGVTYYFKQFK